MIEFNLHTTKHMIHFYRNRQMASFTLNLDIGDFLTPIKESLRSFMLTKDQRDSYIHAFDIFVLRTIIVVILLATMVLTIMCVPYVIKIIETLLLSLQSLPRNIRSPPGSMSSFLQLTTLLPLLFLLMD